MGPEVNTTPVETAADEGAAPGWTLTVLDGPDRGRSIASGEGEGSRVYLGQSSACALRLADRHVSRRHAAIVRGERDTEIVDLDSTNGTTVNGTRVLRALLASGDTVRLGETTLRFDVIDRGAPPPISTASHFGRVLGSSVEMRRLYPVFQKVADAEVHVVVEGETGTGKEILAESLHEASPRASGPFVVFDCTAVPPNLVESEIFGHEKGAFTGATTTRRGLFEQAHGGTLFLDEIGELELGLQPKLLRVLEQSRVRRVGGESFIPVDARVIAATRRDLDREVQDGRFRDDLFFRLNVARLELPPLRERHGDVAFLARHFWQELARGAGPLPYKLLTSLERHAWPGNVRELRNAVARHVALGELAGVAPESARRAPATDPFEAILAENLPFPLARDRVVRAFERRYVERVLEREGGSVARAANASGIARRYFNTILARHRG
jgi:DNA-binding NtrC family response regulator